MPKSTVDVMFGEWLPAQPSYKNPGCLVAKNVVPTPGGYGPFRGPAPDTVTANGAIRGAARYVGDSGTRVIVGGAATRLFVLRGGALNETTGLTDIGAGGSWDFARFGNSIIATGPGNPPRYLDNLNIATTWANLPGAPTALYSERVEDFLMLGNVATFPSRVQWSALNNPLSWGTNTQTQSGFLDCPRELGEVVGITGGRFPMIFQERGVSRINYAGPPTIWQREEIEQARGCIAPFSIVQVGFLVYYLTADGFYMTDGSQFQALGTGRLTRWFLDDADPVYIGDTHGAIDWQNACVVWSYKSAAGGGTFDKLLIYSWAEERFSTADMRVGRLLDTQTTSMTLEDIGNTYSSIDDVPGSLDDPKWQGSARVLGAFINERSGGVWTADTTLTVDSVTLTADGSGGNSAVISTRMNYFSGETLQAEIETGEIQPMPGKRVFVSGAMPLVDENDRKARVATVARQGNREAAYSAFASPGPSGMCPLRADGVTMRLACRIPAGASWSDAQGLQVKFRPSGGR